MRAWHALSSPLSSLERPLAAPDTAHCLVLKAGTLANEAWLTFCGDRQGSPIRQ